MTDAIPLDKSALRVALLARYPWLAESDVGPRSVEAGECDRCENEARLVAPCGPPPDGACGSFTAHASWVA